MKIRITKSNNKDNWYHSAIGMEFEVEAYHNAFWGVTNGKFLSWADEDDCIEVKENKFTGKKIGKLRNGDLIEIDFDNDCYYYKNRKFRFSQVYRDSLKTYNDEKTDGDIVELYDLTWREEAPVVSK